MHRNKPNITYLLVMSQHSGVKTESTFVMETKIDMLVVASLGAIILLPSHVC